MQSLGRRYDNSNRMRGGRSYEIAGYLRRVEQLNLGANCSIWRPKNFVTMVGGGEF